MFVCTSLLVRTLIDLKLGDLKNLCTFIGGKKVNVETSFRIFANPHLHSYCSLPFQSWFHNTYFSEIWPCILRITWFLALLSHSSETPKLIIWKKIGILEEEAFAPHLCLHALDSITTILCYSYLGRQRENANLVWKYPRAKIKIIATHEVIKYGVFYFNLLFICFSSYWMHINFPPRRNSTYLCVPIFFWTQHAQTWSRLEAATMKSEEHGHFYF